MTESPALIGQRYRLGPVIGQGGMGVVRQATDVTLEREVAIKLLRADLTDDSAALDRFRAEARAAAGLSHPAIVSVFDFGQRRHIGRDGVRLSAYLVMELVRGETLYSVLRSGPLQPGRAVQVAAGILHALKHAHRQGVVHRDIKPSNIMIQPSGAVKVMDFGIAHTLGEVEPGGPEAPGERLVMGTSHYMSPEQARCEPVDGRADIYAVGCVLFEMLTGERPFVADAPELIVQKHLTDPAPAPSSRVPGLPAAFDWVVARALAKSPDGRYPNVDAFLDDLSHLADQAAAAAGPPLAAPSQLAARQPAGQADGSAEDSGPSFSIAPVAGWRGGAQPSPHAASPPATPTPFPADAPAVPEYLRRA
ncbi:MAG: protein kinase, partial [Bifidobacteriaceae bacterium]|nr:protein kinase [Bifidobacteriaceae bacterium]